MKTSTAHEIVHTVLTALALVGLILIAASLAGCEVFKAGYDACRQGDCR